MKSDNKNEVLKEKLKQALTSTARAISDDFKNRDKPDKSEKSKFFDNFDLENLDSKSDFIKARAEADSLALKKKFSDDKIFKKNSPSNLSCKSLYSIAEKIRYESLGCKMLKGVQKNLVENYNQIIELKRKDQLKSKDDVPIAEAFELYMLKNFLKIKLNPLSDKILSYWEEDFKSSFDKHLSYLSENIKNQEKYS